MSTEISVKNALIKKRNTFQATVSEKPIAKLMYYLSCVNDCINVDLPSECTNYANYNNITFDTMIRILKYAKIFSPYFMKRNGIFRNNPDECIEFLNEFYDVAGIIEIQASTDENYEELDAFVACKYMAYKNEWMKKHYYQPMDEFSREIRAIENDTIEELRPRKHSYNGSNNPFARLMYYLSCVNDCVSADIPYNVMNYRNYLNNSFDDEVSILNLAKEINPSVLKRNGVFVDKIKYCGDYTNKFYQISELGNIVSYNREFKIGDKKIRTLKFMVFHTSWLKHFYQTPMKKLSEKVNAINNGTIELLRPRKHSYNGSDDPFARLMYYLSCVNNLIDFEFPNDLIQYQNYQNISTEKQNQIVCFAIYFEPEFFIEKNVMINDLLICGNYTNKFYNVSELPNKKPILEFNFANKLIHTQKIMIFDEEWIQTFYRNPMETQEERLKAISNGTIKKFKAKNNVHDSSNKDASKNDKSCLIQ